jgi:hypothetical protein
MRFAAAVVFFTLIRAGLAGQAPGPAAAAAAQTAAAVAQPAATAKNDSPPTPVLPQIIDPHIGFSYGLPADWQTEALQMTKPNVPFPTVQAPLKGNACAQVELTARHGTPSSVVVVVALPFDCYGQTLRNKNLADLATGASDGLKQTFEVTNPVVGNYVLGSHNMWIERASGTVKGQPAAKYTLEIVCTLLEKGMACWWMMAADEASLQTFEQQPVTLEGDAFEAIVPAGAVLAPIPAAKKPS